MDATIIYIIKLCHQRQVLARNMVIVTIGNDNVTSNQANVNEAVIIGIAKKYFF